MRSYTIYPKSNFTDTPPPTSTTICPYLTTISRPALAFDAPAVCSVSLSESHVYCCLICGGFFRGRGEGTPAYTHALETGHQIFIGVGHDDSSSGSSPSHPSTSTRGRVYCIPDNYEVHDASLDDIRSALSPSFTPSQIAAIDANNALSRDVHGSRYLPGYAGMNNLRKTDYINSVTTALAHVPPLRDYFLAGALPLTATPLVRKFGRLLQQIWSSSRFKSGVDPHEFVNEVASASAGRFSIGVQGEAGEFLSWLLHTLNRGLGGGKKKKKTKKRAKTTPTPTIIESVFGGQVSITTRSLQKKVTKQSNVVEDDRGGSDEEGVLPPRTSSSDSEEEEVTTKSETAFFQLTLDIPQKPLFKDDDAAGVVVPQEPISRVLAKFDGSPQETTLRGSRSLTTFDINSLPPYIILHLKRFKKNDFFTEKNATIITFPISGLDLSPYFRPKNATRPPSESDIRAMSVKEMRAFVEINGRENALRGGLEKSDLIDLCIKIANRARNVRYNLIANVCHESPAEVGKEGKRDPLSEGSYHVHVKHNASSTWFKLEDLDSSEFMAELVGLSESYIMIFGRQTA